VLRTPLIPSAPVQSRTGLAVFHQPHHQTTPSIHAATGEPYEYHPDIYSWTCRHRGDRFDASKSVVNHSLPPSPPPVEGRFIRFSSGQLRALNAKATDPNVADTFDWTSTSHALSAHLCQRVHRARLRLRASDSIQGVGPFPKSNFLTPVNLRSRPFGARLPATAILSQGWLDPLQHHPVRRPRQQSAIANRTSRPENDDHRRNRHFPAIEGGAEQHPSMDRRTAG